MRSVARWLGARQEPETRRQATHRLLSNGKLAPWPMLGAWVKYVVATRDEILVALDWAEFDDDDQSTVSLYLITRHGRATPLVWKTVRKSTLTKRRNGYEDEAIERVHEALPDHVRVTLLADRGFGDQKRHEHLTCLGWDDVIRFREGVLVTSAQGASKTAAQWPAPWGRAKGCYWFMAIPRMRTERLERPRSSLC